MKNNVLSVNMKLMNDNSYPKWVSMSDKNLIETIGVFIQHHRLSQNKSQNQVASDAGISRSTLSLLERGEKTNLNSLIQVLRVLDLLHVMNVFHIEKEVSPIAYAKLQKKNRKRARNNNEPPQVNEDIGW